MREMTDVTDSMAAFDRQCDLLRRLPGVIGHGSSQRSSRTRHDWYWPLIARIGGLGGQRYEIDTTYSKTLSHRPLYDTQEDLPCFGKCINSRESTMPI